MEKKQQPKKERSARFPSLIDLAERDGRVGFLVQNDDGLPEFLDEYRRPGQPIIVPPAPWQIPFSLPTADAVLRHRQLRQDLRAPELLADVRDYISTAAALPAPEEQWLDVLACWVFHTYVYEFFPYSPYLCFFAVPERGKTRLGKALTYLSYRGYMSPSVSPAQIFRLAEYFGVTLFLDISNLRRRAQGDAQDLLLHRFEQGASVARVVNPEKGAFEDMRYWSVYGPTIIATNDPIDRILETRTLNVMMPEVRRRTFGDPATPRDGMPFRERLTEWRGRAMALERFMPGCAFAEVGKPVPGRLGDIVHPILRVANEVDPSRVEGMIDLFRSLELERRSEVSFSWEADVVRALVELRGQVRGGLLPTVKITETVNATRHEAEKLYPQKVGTILKAHGLSARKVGGYSHVTYDVQKILGLADRFCPYDESVIRLRETLSAQDPIPAAVVESGDSKDSNHG